MRSHQSLDENRFHFVSQLLWKILYVHNRNFFVIIKYFLKERELPVSQKPPRN